MTQKQLEEAVELTSVHANRTLLALESERFMRAAGHHRSWVRPCEHYCALKLSAQAAKDMIYDEQF